MSDINIYFVLPANCEDELSTTEEMQAAFEVTIIVTNILSSSQSYFYSIINLRIIATFKTKFKF